MVNTIKKLINDYYCYFEPHCSTDLEMYVASAFPHFSAFVCAACSYSCFFSLPFPPISNPPLAFIRKIQTFVAFCLLLSISNNKIAVLPNYPKCGQKLKSSDRFTELYILVHMKRFNNDSL